VAACVAALGKRPVAVAPSARSGTTAATAGSAAGECRIKGNVGASGRVYHLPGSGSYDKTVISASKGERWFCSEEEARAAGWRAPRG